MSKPSSRRRKEAAEVPPAHLVPKEPVDYTRYTMYLQTSRPHIIRAWIEGLRYLLQEGSIIFTPESSDSGHLTLASTNSSESVLVFSKIHSTLFDTVGRSATYPFAEASQWFLEQKTVVSLNFGQLHRAIRSTSEKDLFTMVGLGCFLLC